MTSGKTLLLVSGGEDAAAMARRAKDMGLTVVMSDSDPQAFGFAFADSCLIADAHGPAETAAAAERYNRKIRKIDGVLGMAGGSPLTVATVADRLRLPGLPIHVAELVQDRLAMKKCFVSAGIASPWFAEIRTPQELQRAVIAQGRDLTITPLEARGAAPLRLNNTEDLAAAFMQVRAQSGSERVMVEKNPEGARLLVAAIVSGGRCAQYGMFDFPGSGEKASQQPEAIQAVIRELAGRAASALGIEDYPVMADMVVQQGQPQLLWLGAGLPGLAALDGSEDIAGAAIHTALRDAAGKPAFS